MFNANKKYQGFSTIELVTVIIIIGILAAASTSVLIPSRSFQLQATRDQLVAAIETAQQRAMSRQNAVRVVLSANQISMQDDVDGDDDFSPAASVSTGGVSYPISLPPSQSLSPDVTLVFDRLGQTSGTTVTLTQSSASVSITITDSGYAY